MNIKDLAKQHGPAVGIAVVAAAVVRLTISSPATTPQPPPISAVVAASHTTPSSTPPDKDTQTRLVSCGGRGASVSGDDASGVVTLGHESKGHCTLVFASPGMRTCAINGGSLSKTLRTEVVVDSIEGNAFAYRCE